MQTTGGQGVSPFDRAQINRKGKRRFRNRTKEERLFLFFIFERFLFVFLAARRHRTERRAGGQRPTDSGRPFQRAAISGKEKKKLGKTG